MSESLPEERTMRQAGSSQLIEDFQLRQDTEFFSQPANRVEFLQSLNFDDFASLTQHINARVRGLEPRNRETSQDKGGYLPMLATPSEADKQSTLKAGFEEISRYLHKSSDSAEQKLRGASMATEALLIWVHPFNDGNGRTSRFLGKFIENGTTDTDALIAETASNKARGRSYGVGLRVDRFNTIDADNPDILLDDDEREELKQAQARMPITQGIPSSIRNLLQDKSLQDAVDAKTAEFNARVAQNEQSEQAA